MEEMSVNDRKTSKVLMSIVIGALVVYVSVALFITLFISKDAKNYADPNKDKAKLNELLKAQVFPEYRAQIMHKDPKINDLHLYKVYITNAKANAKTPESFFCEAYLLYRYYYDSGIYERSGKQFRATDKGEIQLQIEFTKNVDGDIAISTWTRAHSLRAWVRRNKAISRGYIYRDVDGHSFVNTDYLNFE